ncbi:MAG TPA: HAD family hydrolase [Candidatus Kapabacteria bacterium]
MVDNYKAILFDFDFTLGDSSRGICESINYALVGIDNEHSPDADINKLIGLTLRSMFEELTGSSDDVHYHRFRMLFNERAEEVVTKHTVIYDGVVQLLENLREEQKQLGVVSTKHSVRLMEIFTKFDLGKYFDLVIGGENVQNHKPHPEGLHLALERMRVAPHEAVYVGDTILDAQAAQSAGTSFIAVTTGTTLAESFIPFSPLAIIDTVSDLYAFKR